MEVTTTRLTYVRPLPFALASAAVTSVVGLIFSLLFWPFMLVALRTMPHNAMPPGAPFSPLVFFAWLPLIYLIGGFIEGFILGILSACIYNVWARWTGGIELRFRT